MHNVKKLAHGVITTFFVSILFLILGFTGNVHATSFELIAPTGTLTRGQSVSFTANIDTQGETLNTAAVGLTYKTEFLQYESATPGDTFETLTASETQPGTILLEGTNTNGFSGTGTFAVINFKLIADSPGETELCTLTTPPVSSTPGPTSSQPLPTSLPTTGQTENTLTPIIVGLGFISVSVVLLVSSRTRRRQRLHK